MKRTIPVLLLVLLFVGCSSPVKLPSLAPPAKYIVSFDSQSATVAAIPDKITVTSPVTNVAALPSNPIKTGYGFGGWWTEINGGGTAFTETTPVTSDFTVYSRWDYHSFTIIFDSQGANVPSDPTSEVVSSPATTLEVFPKNPQKDGQVFSGWWTESSGGGTQFTSSTIVDKSLTVFAKWVVAPPVLFVWGTTSWDTAVWQ
jgi:hypothetical protein